MAIEIHLPRKYSSETLEFLKAAEGPNLIMTPGAVETTIERNTDKAGQPVTKQSVLDIFNKQVIERINSIPKFSRDYFFVETGELDMSHAELTHSEFVGKLGNAYLSNEYGFMAICDYLKLSDFVDREGDITIDDLANTFTNTINKLSTLCRFDISISMGTPTGGTYLGNYRGFAIGKEQTTNLVNFNEVRNQLVNSRDFNSVCKKWYKKILENAGRPDRNIIYKYQLQIPWKSDFKFFLKERNFGRPGPENERYPGENRIQFTSLFAHSISSAYFRIPKVTRPIRSIIFKVNRHGGNHRQPLSILRPMLINERNGTIVSDYNLQRSIYFGSGDGNLRIDFDKCLLRGDSYSTDLILTFEITTTGDRYDASWVYMEVESIIYGDGIYTTELNSDVLYPKKPVTLDNPPLPTIGNEIIKVPDTDDYSDTFKYTVKNVTRKMSDIYFTLEGSGLGGNDIKVSSEVYRNGNRIGNGIIVYRTKPWEYHSHGWNYDPIIRVSVSHLDIKNGDEILIKFDGRYYHSRLKDVFERSVFKVVRILYLPFKEKLGGFSYGQLTDESFRIMNSSYYGDNIRDLLNDKLRVKYLDID